MIRDNPGDDKKEGETSRDEEAILEFWRKNNIFRKTLTKDAPAGGFVFYDGPPFANGLPHYGHILASVIKDAIPRYKTMRGYRVPRRFGWDCHGLPVENVAEKELGLKSKKEIEKLGINKFNAAARRLVLAHTGDWRRIIPRLGRFVDMDDDYRTMDLAYTESVWWVFKTLYDKGLIYEGQKSMHLCPRCETTLANFEVSQGYKEITDLSVVAEFKLAEKPNTSLLAWTTTPWTLPGNAALAINPKVEYVEVSGQAPGNTYIIARSRAEAVFGKQHQILRLVAPEELIGKSYQPIFNYYQNKSLANFSNGWKVYAADFVSTEEGTGIVHIAPAFGDDDMALGEKEKLPFIEHLAVDGRFKEEVTDFAGLPVKPKGDHQRTDRAIIDWLEKRDALFSKIEVTHSYPHCWRCDTPLLNWAADSWFVKVTALKDKLVAANGTVNWQPPHVKEGRFGKWLEGARDWAISRQRFWGAPLPVWQCQRCAKKIIIGSLEELRQRTDKRMTKFILLRHGESEKNIKGVADSSDSRYPLTDKGRQEAQEAAKRLRLEGVDAIYTSAVRRAKETADIIGRELSLEPVTSRAISEIDSGDWEDKPTGDPKLKETYNRYRDLALAERYKTKRGQTGESWQDLESRVGEFLTATLSRHAGQTVAVVSHLGTNIYFTKLLESLDEDDTFRRFRSARYTKYASPIVIYADSKTGKVIDLHRPDIDKMPFVCDCGELSKRIPDVFDCWFESGSMPYGQAHYPFGASGEFDPIQSTGFPADFIAEGLDQTRGWFYSLLVLGVALFDRSPYRQVVVNGLVLASDGQKMSKRLNNYPDPMAVVNRFGADALRLYLLSSPVVRGEDLNFSEEGVLEKHRKVILRLKNVLAFWKLYADPKADDETSTDGETVLDRWMFGRLRLAASSMAWWLDRYQIDRAERASEELIDDLSVWYLRRSRERFRDPKTKTAASKNLRQALKETALLLAPAAPFTAEMVYQAVKKESDPLSVHLADWPSGVSTDKSDEVDSGLNEAMEKARRIATVALKQRLEAGLPVRQPLGKLTINLDLPPDIAALLAAEVNVKTISVDLKQGTAVILDTELSSDLAAEGLVREIVRQIQAKRKTLGLNPDDVIRVTIKLDPVRKQELAPHKNYIQDRVLARELILLDYSGKLEPEVEVSRN